MSNNVNCPYCDYEIDTTDWFERFTYNDEFFDVDCPKCENTCVIQVDITPTYEVSK